MTTIVVLVVAVCLLALVFRLSGRYGDKNRGAGTSLRRGPHAHTTSRGRPKKAYATREIAVAQAQQMSKRGGAAMSAYQCERCGKWHLGHG
jgi:hypothetical protein